MNLRHSEGFWNNIFDQMDKTNVPSALLWSHYSHLSEPYHRWQIDDVNHRKSHMNSIFHWDVNIWELRTVKLMSHPNGWLVQFGGTGRCLSTRLRCSQCCRIDGIRLTVGGHHHHRASIAWPDHNQPWPRNAYSITSDSVSRCPLSDPNWSQIEVGKPEMIRPQVIELWAWVSLPMTAETATSCQKRDHFAPGSVSTVGLHHFKGQILY